MNVEVKVVEGPSVEQLVQSALDRNMCPAGCGPLDVILPNLRSCPVCDYTELKGGPFSFKAVAKA